jgi:predicted TIM-barrel fold metal-dependent hydrolase
MDLTRRQFGAMSTAGLAGVLVSQTGSAAAPDAQMPAGACDCHVHIIGNRRQYPMAPDRGYTPPEATVDSLRNLRARLGYSRNVLVQPSFYGTNNTRMLAALAELGDSARGIAVLKPQVTPTELKRLEGHGVRGVRLNLESSGNRDAGAAAELLGAFAQKIAPLHWHIQIYTVMPVIAALAHTIADLPVPVVIDHYGMAQAAMGVNQPGFGALLELVRAKKAYVKLSAPYRLSTRAPDYPDVEPLARALIAAGRDRMLWGSDWPHTHQTPGLAKDKVSPFSVIDDVAVTKRLLAWCGDDATRTLIFAQTPEKLYRFAAA